MIRCFKYREDRVPVLLFLALFVLDVLVYLRVDSVVAVAAWMLAGALPKACICAWNHHHQHAPTFRQTPLNRLLEVVLAFQTGVMTNGWVLHHVLGHHVNYLDQRRDESAWRRRDGAAMGALEYTLTNAVLAYPRAVRVGRHHPEVLRGLAGWSLVVLGLLGLLLYADWVNAVLLFVVPMVTGMLVTVWHTYYHHAGLDAGDHFHASYNITNRLYNRLTGNLGYHTAHHVWPGLHWSRLPEAHRRIEGRIPATLTRR